jgi:hypothetical protein
MTKQIAIQSAMPDWQWHCIRMTYNSNVETALGYVLEKYEEVKWDSMAVFVQTVDATETVDVGLTYAENSNGGDADGFLSLISIATAGWVRPTIAITQGASNAPYVSTCTYGAYFLGGFKGSSGTGVTNFGSEVMKNHIGDGTQKTMSYTCSSGSDTFVGFLYFQTRRLPDLTDFLT